MFLIIKILFFSNNVKGKNLIRCSYCHSKKSFTTKSIYKIYHLNNYYKISFCKLRVYKKSFSSN